MAERPADVAIEIYSQPRLLAGVRSLVDQVAGDHDDAVTKPRVVDMVVEIDDSGAGRQALQNRAGTALRAAVHDDARVVAFESAGQISKSLQAPAAVEE